MEIFVSRLNELLKLNSVSRYKLAKSLSVNPQTVAFWCNGVNEPKISYLVALCRFFEVSADYLLGLSDW